LGNFGLEPKLAQNSSIATDWKATDWLIAIVICRKIPNNSKPIEDARIHAMFATEHLSLSKSNSIEILMNN
jgi:hypothetical protein